MKIRLSIFLLLTTISFVSLSQQASVKGSLKGTDNICSQLIVNAIKGNRLAPIDTVSLDSHGNYQFSLPATEPSLYILSLPIAQSPNVHLLVAPKEKISLDLVYNDDSKFLSVKSTKGSKNMELYRLVNQEFERSSTIQRQLDKEYIASGTSEQRKRELEQLASANATQQNTTIERLIHENHDLLFAAFLVTYFDQNASEFLHLYREINDALSPQYPSDPFVLHVASIVKSNIGPGMPAPDIAMKNPDGQIIRLSDLRGKVVLLDFWASWCRPCRAENPNVVRLYQKYKDAGFDVFSVSMDQTKAAWLKGIADDGLSWSNHVSDLQGWTSSGGALYGVSSIPTTYLIDREGNIIAKNLRGNDLAKKLQELFGF